MTKLSSIYGKVINYFFNDVQLKEVHLQRNIYKLLTLIINVHNNRRITIVLI